MQIVLPLSRRSCSYFRQGFYSFTELAGNDNDLAARDLSKILEGLDNAIECMADWSDDELNTARDRRGRRRKPLSFGAWSTS
jgi:hypothetical protein